VKFFQDVAEACPEMAICVYANPMAFRFAFPPPFWAQIADLPQVVTAKYGPIARLLTDLDASRKKIRFMPNDLDYYAAARIDPDFFTAFWSSGAVCGPTVATRLHGLVEQAKNTNDWKAAKDLSDRIGQATAPMFPRGNLDEFSKYNIGIEKEKMNAAGWMHAGPCRPPYTYLPAEYAEGARTAGRMWSELELECRALSKPVAHCHGA
jgi:trans-o-hydroxybenzylidenepyruvate hydratase-aldolase